MALDVMYLTVGREKHDARGYLAVISYGSSQRGDRECDCTVLSVEIVENMKAAKFWYKRIKIEKPWEMRQ